MVDAFLAVADQLLSIALQFTDGDAELAKMAESLTDFKT